MSDPRLAWWHEAKFGLFIHWGLYSILEGRWGERTDHAEWIRDTAQIPLAEYDKLIHRFNPKRFDPDEWVALARQAGMKYLVITTKHHDGFCLFDTPTTDWCVRNTPYGMDIMAQIADACRRGGLRLGWYHSIMDWHHPDYLPKREWETVSESEQGWGQSPGNAGFQPAAPNMDRYVEYLRAQVTELLTNYGKVDIMWFDGEWESTWHDGYGRPLYELCRSLQPDIIVNNRVSNNRQGSCEAYEHTAGSIGDFGTPEQNVPDTTPTGQWESCITMNDNWGYNAADHNWKSVEQLQALAQDIWSRGGNLLLNVGPTADGEFPPEAVERLRAFQP